jgi:cellulose 1,4-beta-cellobiosidase
MIRRIRMAVLVISLVLSGVIHVDAAQAAVHRVANPYAGAVGYVNAQWTRHVLDTAAATGGQTGARMTAIARTSTAVWLDRLAKIGELRGHLDAALAQQRTARRPVVVTLVLYNLPDRNCTDEVDDGELFVGADGIARYRAEFVDPIARILAEPRYAGLRIATVIEPDALSSLARFYPLTIACQVVAQSRAYLDGMAYALDRLSRLRNVYTYLDVAHGAEVGWDSVFSVVVDAVTRIAGSTAAGVNAVHGLSVNAADYTPLREPFIPPGTVVNGVSILQSRFYDWNPMVDNAQYVSAVVNALVGRGFPSRLAAIVDTSRDGWGGPARPTALTTSFDVNTFVDLNRVDRRLLRGNSCNQAGAGLGARPQADPMPRVHAFVWIKPPGESDGVSDRYDTTGIDPPDKMCDPTYSPPIGSHRPTGALPGAPHRGEWFASQFTELITNAYPPISA